MEKLTKDDLRKLQAIDAWYWAYSNKLNILGGEFALKGHTYQPNWLKEKCRSQSYKKGAQLGITSIHIIKSLHGMIYNNYPQGVLYLFPTRDDVTDFSKSRFQPLIQDNPEAIGRFVHDTDAANIKKIGKAMLYLRGAKSSQKIEGTKASSSQLKSIPVDKIIFDEMDEMEPSMIALAIERVSHSSIQEIIKISTPTIPLYGIDKDYNDSDQRIWVIKCHHCNTENCLELEFPDCLMELRDRVIRVCKKCKNEIFSEFGQWIPQYPNRSKDSVGWWISQLNSAYVEPGKILKMFLNPLENGTTLQEVYNSKLGLAYIAAENKLTRNDIYACCNQDVMSSTSHRATAMGVDVGNMLHIVIGYKKDEKRFKIVATARVSNFKDVHDLAKRHNTKIVVIDMEPETRKAREFKDSHSPDYKVFLCDYQERLKSARKRDEKEGNLTVRRTETLDMVHDAVTNQLIELPRRSPEIEQYALEMTNIAKVIEEDEITGSRSYKYRKLGDDHYFHATNYFLLACEDYIISMDTDLQTGYDYKQDEKLNEYCPFSYIK